VKYSNEVKVGITLILATAIFVFGIRYFQALPIFGTTNDYSVEFVDASGLISGNAVRVNGVTVGAVTDVKFNPETLRARVKFHLSGDIDVYDGTTARVSGISALGVVKLDVFLGDRGAPVLTPGSSIDAINTPDIMSDVMEKGPLLLEGIDSVLSNMNSMLASTNDLVDESSPRIQNSLGSVESIVAGLDQSLQQDRHTISEILANMSAITSNVDTLTAGHADSLAVLFENLSRSARRMDQTLASIDMMASDLAELLKKVNEGEGTLGLLVNDPTVYLRMDSTLMSMNALLKSFNEDPGRFTKEMKVIDLF
jgi:phospholipid/cholesterol/gamma-HCH transport system substrate-binding protein